MIHLLNLVPEDSPTKGWGVEISPVRGKEHLPDLKNYAIALNGSEGVRIAIDRSRFDKLVAYDAQEKVVVDRFVPVSIYSIFIAENKYLPVVTSAQSAEDDKVVLMLNFETDLGSVIHDVELENFVTISYLVKNKDFRTKLALSGIGTDKNKESSITIKYGYNNGKTLLSNKIIIPPVIIPAEFSRERRQLRIENDQEIIEKITLGNIILPKMDLSNICVNNRER